MTPEDTKKIVAEAKTELKGEFQKAIQELGPDELAAVESISAGEGDIVICNSKCAAA